MCNCWESQITEKPSGSASTTGFSGCCEVLFFHILVYIQPCHWCYVEEKALWQLHSAKWMICSPPADLISIWPSMLLLGHTQYPLSEPED